AGPVIPNEEYRALRVGSELRTDFDPRVLALARVLDGVAQQVDEKLLQQKRVNVAVRQLTDDDLDLAAFGLGGKLGESTVDRLAGPDRLRTDGLACERRECQEIVHQVAHVLPVVLDSLQVASRLLGTGRSVVFQGE